MNRDALERSTASLVVFLTTAFALGIILIAANAIFGWDIFTTTIEKLLYFLAITFLVVILAATLINVMLNISRLAFFSSFVANSDPCCFLPADCNLGKFEQKKKNH